jgi:hypothetical protein
MTDKQKNGKWNGDKWKESAERRKLYNGESLELTKNRENI